MRNASISRNAAIGLIVALLTAGVLWPATVRRITMDTLVARSDRIVYGRVVASRAVWDPETRTIWTNTEIRILDVAKGSAGNTVTISEPGGVLGDVGHFFPGVPQFQLSQEVLVFLHGAAGNRLRVTGLRQGVYAITTDPATHERMARPMGKQAEPVMEDGSRAETRAPREPIEDCRLEQLLQHVRQRVR
jgi:hypothetical protein